jgi:phasin
MSDAQVETVKAVKAEKPVEKQPNVTAKPVEKQPNIAAKPVRKQPNAAAKPTEKLAKVAAPAAEASLVAVESVREAVESGVTQAKESYERAKATAEESTAALEETFAAAIRGANDINEYVMAAFKDETRARFDLVRDLARAGTPLEAFELQGKFLRARLDAAQARGSALAKLVSRVSKETAEPARESMLRTIRTLTPAS